MRGVRGAGRRRRLAGQRRLAEMVPALACSRARCTVEELTERLLTALGAAGLRTPAARNPYQGLRAFDEADAENYFGRAALIDDVLGALVRGRGCGAGWCSWSGAPVPASPAPSGPGCCPGCAPAGRPARSAWFVATMLPGGAPYKELAESLRRIAVGDTDGSPRSSRASTASTARCGRWSPRMVSCCWWSTSSRSCSRCRRRPSSGRSSRALTHALTVPDSRLRVVATLRADYYDRPLGVQPFGALVQDATVTIPAMLPAEVEAAVVEPAQARRAHGRARPGRRAGRLAGREPAALPALQFVLFELAERSADGTLSLAAYRAIGGIEGAIAARAEGLYLSLDDPTGSRCASSSSASSW